MSSFKMRKNRLQIDYPLESIEHIIAGELRIPVLFLHGWGGNCTTMNSLIQPISAHRKTVSISMPGFGNSPEPSDEWGTWDYVEAVHQWMDLNGLEIVDIISHSFGGRVAIGLAHRYPKNVNTMVLIDSAGLVLPRSPKVWAKLFLSRSINRLGNLIGGELKEKLHARKSKLGSADWKAASPVMRRILGRVIREDLSLELREIKTRTLLLWGSTDSAVPVKLGKRMNQLIQDSKITILPNAGHYPFLDEPGKSLTVVWDWLELPAVW
jgi:pimeloyl-ACP methyl ester carboxylesterase